MGIRISYGTDIIPEILHAELIVEQLLERHIVLAQDTSSILGDIDLRIAVSLTEPLEQFPESDSRWSQPGRLCDRSDTHTILVFQQDIQVTRDIIDIRFSGLGADEVRAVVVHPVEVIATLDEGNVLW